MEWSFVDNQLFRSKKIIQSCKNYYKQANLTSSTWFCPLLSHNSDKQQQSVEKDLRSTG